MTTPEQRARETIDAKLAECGWVVQSRDEVSCAPESGASVSVLPPTAYALFARIQRGRNGRPT
jgi:hypothetical protein